MMNLLKYKCGGSKLTTYIYIEPKTIKMSDLTIYDLLNKRVRLIEMLEDYDPIKPGTEGLVYNVGADVINVRWDDGRSLGMIWGLDKFEIIN